MNNKYDSIQDGKYGELYVPTGKKSKFTFKGTITLEVQLNIIQSIQWWFTFIDLITQADMEQLKMIQTHN
ncbi:Uncharacterised protein [Mycoplasmopsis fermentans]|nr:Uncharacterised protein [Mycoplasmopsis fermentans]